MVTPKVDLEEESLGFCVEAQDTFRNSWAAGCRDGILESNRECQAKKRRGGHQRVSSRGKAGSEMLAQQIGTLRGMTRGRTRCPP